MELTIIIPDELGTQMNQVRDQLPEILALGYRRWIARESDAYFGVEEILERLAELPSAEEVLRLRPSAELQQRVSELLAKNRSEGLSAAEEREWEHYEHLEHVIRMAKARAAVKVAESKAG